MEPVIDQPISLDAVITFLVSTPLFDDLDAAERGEVVRIMEVQRLQVGEEVFHEGATGDSWYVLFEGQVEVTRVTGDGSERRIALLDAGTCFGEMAVLDGSPRSATVRAAAPITVFRFRRRQFDDLLAEGSLGAYKLVAAMAHVQSQRLRQLTQQVSDLLDQASAGPASAGIGGLVDRYAISE